MSLIHRQGKVTRDHVVLSASVLSRLRSACLTSPELLWTCVTRLRPRGEDKEEVWEEEREAETTGCFIQCLVKERKTRFPPSFMNTSAVCHQIIAICIGPRPGFCLMHNKASVWRRRRRSAVAKGAKTLLSEVVRTRRHA